MIRIVSWNVNGIRACANKGFLDWLKDSGADVIGLQETRVEEAQLESEIRYPNGYDAAWTSCKVKRGYSGVALFTKKEPKNVVRSIGAEEFDGEGRVVIAEFSKLLFASVYFPNGGGKDGDNARVPYKLAFYDRFFDYIEERQKTLGKPAIVMGDMNTAHKEIDIARPKENQKASGFLPEERDHFGGILKRGWIDTYRALNPETVKYSWWSTRLGARKRNVGWRIDYVLVPEALKDKVKCAFIDNDILGSDHCPVGIDLDFDLE